MKIYDLSLAFESSRIPAMDEVVMTVGGGGAGALRKVPVEERSVT
jgi:hypothetical protein